MPRDLQTAGGRQAKTQRQLTAEDIFRNNVDGINVDDGFIFVGGQAAFFPEAELRGDLMSDLTGWSLTRKGCGYAGFAQRVLCVTSGPYCGVIWATRWYYPK